MPDTNRMPTVLCFDVEDIIAPEEDDAALWLADILHAHGLTGSFMVVGERARQWERRGRRDVIEALKNHDISFHSTWHSVHPTTTEICLDKDFAVGMEALWEWDAQGWADAERIMGRPLPGWARSGGSWSPSLMGLMGRMGRAYIYSLVRLPGHLVCWYANCLSFFGEGVGGFDPTFCDDALFEQKLAEVQREVDEYVRADWWGARWLCFFMCHPTRVIHTEFWDAVNFAKGANPPREAWRPATRQPDALIPTMQKNYRRLCEWLRAHERLEIVGWSELIRRYDGQRPFAEHNELQEIARRIAEERQVLFTDHFTAGELLLMLCRVAAAPQTRYSRPSVYGPLKTPPVSSVTEFAAEDVKAAARAVVKEAERTGCLPASVEVGGQPVGLGTFFVALAEAVLGLDRVSGPADAPYPPAAEEVARDAARSIPHWVIHPEDMDLSNLLEQTRLQCWALKPAWPRERRKG
jgi:hypothetical protein